MAFLGALNGDPETPFFVAQLAPYWTVPVHETFPAIRIAQASIDMPRTGYAVLHDIGDHAGLDIAIDVRCLG